MGFHQGADPGPSVTEKLVARLWEDQGPFVLPLATTGGEEIQVIYRGRRRWDRGPDFVGALIAWPEATLRHGDVEIHTRSSHWRAHGHHRDPNYNRVMLQAVMWDDLDGPVVRADGVRVPAVALARHLAVALETLPDLSPAAVPPRPPCRREAPSDLATLSDLLERCGLERFAAKAARFESDLACCEPSAFGFQPSAVSRRRQDPGLQPSWHSPDQLLYAGIAEALGYSRNRAPLRRLAELLPLDLLLAYRSQPLTPNPQPLIPNPWSVEPLLLGAAGLLPSRRGQPVAEADLYVRALVERWSADATLWAGGAMAAGEWEFFRVHPANFPTRRVAALARLVDLWPPGGLAGALESLVRGAQLRTPSGGRALARALEGLLEGGRTGYWAEHCHFGLRLPRPANLVGRLRAAEVAVNIFLPFLAGRASHLGDGDLRRRTEEAFRLYPKRGDNELSRHVAVQITGHPRPPSSRSACRQQGLLHVYWTWCEAKRCQECPCRHGSCGEPSELYCR